MSVEDDIVILGDQVADQIDISDWRVVRPLNDAMGNSWHTPSVNRNDTTIDLASPRKDNVKAAGSSTTACSALEVPQDAPSLEPLTCPICLESIIALSKGRI